MRSMFRATVIALALTSIAGIAQAQIKIAFVNSQALMEAAPGRAAAESLLTKEGEGYRTQLQKLQDSVNNMLTKYQKDEPTLTATTKDTRQKAIQALEADLQAKQQQFQQQFAQRQSEVMAPVTDVVKKVLDDIRTENGYAMILDNAPGASNIVSADKNLDITDKVVSRLRATSAPVRATTTTPAKPGAASAPAGVTRPKPPNQ
jgi:outer membrane protein